MKKALFLLLFVTLFSCSSDEATQDDANDNLPATTYINFTTNNFWKYRIETKNGTQPTVEAPNLDHLKVGSEVVENNINYKIMEAVTAPVGFFTGVMDQKKLRKVSDEIRFTGNVALEIGNGVPTQNIPVADFKIFKQSAANGTVLETKTGTLAPIPLDLNGISTNIIVNYSLSSVSGETLASFTPPIPNSGVVATTYSNIKVVKFVLNINAISRTYINIAGTLFPIDTPILSPANQDVIISTQYYADGKGVVYTQTNTNFSFATLPGESTPVLPAINILQRIFG